MQLISILSLLLPLALAQQYTTPVPILKQINKHNEDGSYSYGYEGADGSFKIETKYPNGEVYGKYGYVDDQGKVREVEYGATRRGFEPAGQEINVAPPTLQNNQEALRPLAPNEEDDGQYREDPSVYYKNEPYANDNNVYNNRPAFQSFQTQNYNNYQPQPAYTNTQSQNYQQPAYQQPTHQQPTYQQTNYQQPAYRPQPTYQQPAYRPQVQHSFNTQPQYSQPQYSQPHPATGVDYASGSYSVSY